jgi:hypothetical protein
VSVLLRLADEAEVLVRTESMTERCSVREGFVGCLLLVIRACSCIDQQIHIYSEAGGLKVLRGSGGSEQGSVIYFVEDR